MENDDDEDLFKFSKDHTDVNELADNDQLDDDQMDGEYDNGDNINVYSSSEDDDDYSDDENDDNGELKREMGYED